MSSLIRGSINEYFFSGSGAFARTVDAAAAADGGRNGEGQPLTTITITANDLTAGDHIYIESTENYDGLHKIIAQATDEIDINAVYVAEVLANTDDLLVTVTEDERWEFVGMEWHSTTANSTAENLTIDVDAARGTAWDTNVYTKDMDAVSSLIYYPDKRVILSADDLLEFTYANSDAVTWGLKVLTAKFV